MQQPDSEPEAGPAGLHAHPQPGPAPPQRVPRCASRQAAEHSVAPMSAGGASSGGGSFNYGCDWGRPELVASPLNLDSNLSSSLFGGEDRPMSGLDAAPPPGAPARPRLEVGARSTGCSTM